MGPIEAITSGLAAIKAVIGILKEAKDWLPKDTEKLSMERKIQEAETSLQLAEGQAAQALGYQLHRCTFPPQIMLSAGHSEEPDMKGIEIFRCPNCGECSPSESELKTWKEGNRKAKSRAKGYSVQ